MPMEDGIELDRIENAGLHELNKPGVMPMQLRSNLGNRLVLRVDSEGTSEIALEEKGAERLLGKEHSAAKLEGEPQIIYGQVPFVEDSFISSVVNALVITI